MNKRIQQLATEAELELTIETKKFAELIVKECVEICMKEFDTGLLMAPQAPWIAEQIKQHFGVEE